MTSVITEQDGSVLVVTIARPEVRNAIDGSVALGVAEAMDRIDEDAEIRAGVITGAGGSFSSGMDLAAFKRGELPYDSRRGFAGLVARPPVKPLVAAVEGVAVAGGFEIVLACDLIVASSEARMALPEVKLGLLPAGGALFRLGRRLPTSIAAEMIYTGEFVGAGRLAELGLVNCVTEPGAALFKARELAAVIASNAPLATSGAKQILRRSAQWDDTDGFERQRPITDMVRASRDAQEGSSAFLERRAPQWTGT